MALRMTRRLVNSLVINCFFITPAVDQRLVPRSEMSQHGSPIQVKSARHALGYSDHRGAYSMPISLIPWKFFNNALQQQNSQTVQSWLVRWTFANDGVALVQEREKNEAPPLSLEEKKKQAELFVMTKGRWPTTFNER